jgi:nitrogen fixation/metabolism regulation signal transduction histidine kinase
LTYHNILFSCPIIPNEVGDFKILGPGNLLISALSNIIDNAIYWVTEKRELEEKEFIASIYVGTDLNSFKGPALIIADNGNGFKLDPEDLIMPYRTTRPGGMGLGLYFVNMVMEIIGGKLIFPDKEEIELPQSYNGALLALIFPK